MHCLSRAAREFTPSLCHVPAVFLVESIDADHSDMMHLKALVFVRPTRDNLTRLRNHLREPKFAEYHLCTRRAPSSFTFSHPFSASFTTWLCGCPVPAVFSNILPGDFMQQLADADVHSVVKQVQEFYGDYYAVNTDLFSLELGKRCAAAVPARWPLARPTVPILVCVPAALPPMHAVLSRLCNAVSPFRPRVGPGTA